MSKKKAVLIDGSSLAYRAFYALPPLTTSDGVQTNAAYGFTTMLLRLIEDEEPDLLAASFDLKGPTFRHREYEDYKASREGPPDELIPQFDMIREILGAFGIPIYEKGDYEADDVLGTIAKELVKKGHRALIVSGDRDVLQLVAEDIEIMYTRRGITDIVRYDLEKVREDYGLEPKKLIDLKSLMGDTSDDIPGVPGIGEVTAKKLISEFDSLEGVLANIEQVSGKKRKENLKQYGEQARLSWKLARIRTDVALDLDVEECCYSEPQPARLREVLGKYEFNNIIKRLGADVVLAVDELDYRVVTDGNELRELTERLQGEDEVTVCFLLSENEGQGKLIGAGIRGEREVGYYVPFRSGQLEATFEPGDLAVILEDLKPGLNIYQAKRAMHVLACFGVELAAIEFDPMLASYLLDPTSGENTLEELTVDFLGVELPQREDFVAEDESLATLSAERARDFMAPRIEAAHRVREPMAGELKEKDLWPLFSEVEIPLIPVLVEMERNGIKVDTGQLAELSHRLGERLDQLEAEIFELAGEEFNVNSPQQLGEILFEKLDLPVLKKTKTGYSTAAEVLEQLKEHHPVPVRVLDYRHIQKLKSTYVDALSELVDPETSRLYTSFNQAITATGRLSSTDPNLQNIPIRTELGREIRSVFIPEGMGRKLLAADYSQIELRVLAHISGDEGLQEAFLAGEDIHTRTASEIFGINPGEVDRTQRRRAKAVNFGIAYGLSPYGLARDLEIGRKEAEEYIEAYFQRYAGVKKYIDETIARAKEQGYVETLFGRRRYLPEIKSRNHHRRSFAERTAINTPIQGTAADIIKMAMIAIYRRFNAESPGADMLLQVHDELVFEVDNDQVEDVAGIVKEEMEGAAELEVPLTVDLKAGDNWRDTSPLCID